MWTVELQRGLEMNYLKARLTSDKAVVTVRLPQL